MAKKTKLSPEGALNESPPGAGASSNGRHRTKGDPGLQEPVSAFSQLRMSGVLSEYPVLLESNTQEGGDGSLDGGMTALRGVLSDCFENGVAGAESTNIDNEDFERLLDAIGEWLITEDTSVLAAENFPESALVEFLGSHGLKDLQGPEIKGALHRLWTALSSKYILTRRSPASLGIFYINALTRHRQRVLERFADEARTVLRELEIRLQLDQSHSEQERGRAAMGPSFGHSASLFMDLPKLADNLPAYHGTKRASEHRRKRLEEAVTAIRKWLESKEEAGGCNLVSSNDELADLFPAGVNRHRIEGDSLRFASEEFERLAGETLKFIRSLCLGCLEIEGNYDPARDDGFLSRMDWRSLTEDEITLIPPLIVLEDASQIRGKMMGSFIEYLESSRPLHALIVDEPKGVLADATEGLYGRSHAGLTAYAMANGRVAVLQSSLAHPEHLYKGFQKLVGLRRPKVSLVSVPVDAESGEDAWRCAEAAVLSRVTPCFFMDPEAGDTWAERIRLQGNPEPESCWPTLPVRGPVCAPSIGDSPELEDASNRKDAVLSWRCTLADYAVFDSAFARKLRTIPSSEKRTQMPVADFLDLPPHECMHAVPYTVVVSHDGDPLRLEVDSIVIEACRERMRFWRLLQELGGINSEYVRRAEKILRAEAEKERASLRSELIAQHKSELERQRQDVAGETINRLVDRLMGGGFSAESLNRPAEGISTSATANQGAATPLAQPPSEGSIGRDELPISTSETDDPANNVPEVSVDEPYIESALCTSCNECTNLNPSAFKYDDNKQAYIADIGAATFSDLVKAAAKCPSRCIHPGKPRADDNTATPALLTLAGKYN